jgi:DNA/RNA-binding domain of Phe-tRNA-synthetase-like protein
MDSFTFVQIPCSRELLEKCPGVELWGVKLAVEQRRDAQFDFFGQWQKLKERWRGATRDDLWKHPVACAFVEFFRSVGVSASRKRPPSAVNLVQRFVIGENQPSIRSIHPLVDAGNLASAESLIPVAVLDAVATDGEPGLDLSVPGDQFLGYGMETPELLPAGTPILRAAGGSVLSVFCYRDGPATAVTEKTQAVWLLACRVPGVERELVTLTLGRALELMSQALNVVAPRAAL